MLSSFRVLIASAIVLTATHASFATLTTDGFESPTFTPGVLNGQNGWASTSDFSIVNNAGNAHAGSQYLNLTGPAGSTGAASNFSQLTAGEIVMSGWFYVDAGQQWVDVQLRDSDDNTPFAAVGFLSNHPDLPGFTNDIVYRRNPSEGGNYVALADYVPNTWFQLEVRTSSVGSSPNGTYDVYLDGNLIGDDLLQRGSANSIGRITLNAEPSANGFRVDDLSVTAVPEPSSLSLLGIGILALSWTRRRSA